MKLQPHRFSDLLRGPPSELGGALLYGPDSGLVRERADRLTQTICPDLKDPFRIADLTLGALSADPARLSDELGAISLIGGRRVVRVREASDALAAPLASALKGARRGDSFLVIEAGDLPARSSLRKFCEAASEIAAVACYADFERDLPGVIRETLQEHRISASGEALAYLVANLGNDRMVTRSELEKLALYVGDGGRVEIADATACVGDNTALSLDEVTLAAADRDASTLDWAITRCLQEGQSPITILRGVMRHFQRLHIASCRMAAGASADDAIRALRPPLFFKIQERVKAQLATWSSRRAAAALEALTLAELNCKRAVLPQETVLRHALMGLVVAARR